jgi:hypothetical protein
VHLLRNSFKYASRKDWAAIAKDLKPVYTAPSEAAALDRFAEFSEIWERKYPAIVRLWTNAWAEFVPFLAFDTEIRTIICTTNDRESQRPDPPGGERPRTLPDRAGRTQMRLPGDHEPGPHRERPTTVVQPVEGSPERIRDHLRRTPIRRPEVTQNKSVTPFS